MLDTDVFVLGGGPAGLAAAIAARLAGFRVLLADAERPPIDKACGEGLMPDSTRVAARLGIRIPCEQGFPFRGIRFQGLHHSVSADFPDGSGLGVRRPLLQNLLVERASQAGVDMLWGEPVIGLQGGTVLLRSKRVEARWVIGADGAQSSVRRWTGLQHFRRDSKRFSYRRHYRIVPWSEYMEIYWGRGSQFYVTPVSANEVCRASRSRRAIASICASGARAASCAPCAIINRPATKSASIRIAVGARSTPPSASSAKKAMSHRLPSLK